MTVIREYELASGLRCIIEDRTYRYFGEYFNVHMVLSARISVDRQMFQADADFAEAAALPLDALTYTRALVKRGVYQDMVEVEKAAMIADFERHSLPYISRRTFLVKFVNGRVAELRKKRARQAAILNNTIAR